MPCEGTMPKQIGQDVYYAIPEAAKLVGVSRMTMLRWATRRIRLPGATMQVLRDPISKRYYIAKDSVAELAKRFQSV
jgi:hypothetical protein